MTVSDNEGGRQQPTPPGRGQAFVFATAAVLVLTGPAVAAVVIWPATATATEGSQRRYRGTVEPCARHGVSFQTTRTRNWVASTKVVYEPVRSGVSLPND